MSIHFLEAGLIGVCFENSAFHLFIRPSNWVWGKELNWFDNVMYYGLGPLFMFAKRIK